MLWKRDGRGIGWRIVNERVGRETKKGEHISLEWGIGECKGESGARRGGRIYDGAALTWGR